MRGIWKVLIFLIPALLITGIALVAVFGPRRAREYVRATARSQAEQALNRPVEVGRAEVGRNQAVFERVVVREREGGPVFARVPRVTVRYSTARIIAALRNPLAAITSVTVTRPEVFLRRNPQAVWNIADLLRRPPRPARVSARVTVVGGTVHVLDESPPRPLLAPQENTFHRVSATVYLTPSGRMHLAGHAQGPAPRLAAISGVASLGGARPALGTLSASNADLPYLWHYFQPRSRMQVTAGRGDLRATMLQRSGGQAPMVTAQTTLRDTAFRLPQVPRPFAGARARAVLAGQSLFLREASTVLGQSPVRAQGLILTLARPSLFLEASSARLSTNELRALFPRGLPAGLRLTGPLQVAGTVSGSPRALLISGQVRAPAVDLSGMVLRPARARISYAGSALYLEDINAALGGGTATGRAWVSAPPGAPVATAFIGQASGVALAALPRNVVPSTLTGRATGPVVLAYLRQPQVVASVRLDGGRLAAVAYDTGYAQVAYAAGTLRLPYARLRTGMGVAVAEGTITRGGTVDMRVAASEVSVAQAARTLGVRRRIYGLGFVSGTVSGTTASPVFVGRVEGVNLNLAGQPVALLTAAVRLAEDRLHLESGVLFYRGAEVAFSGTVGPLGTEAVPVDVSATARQASLGTVLELLGRQADAYGIVEANLHVGGTLDTPRVRGDLETFFPVVAGQPFDQGAVYFTYGDGVFTLEDARLLADSSTVLARGAIGPEQRVDITISGERLDLARLAVPALRDLGLSLSGEFTLAGRVTGTTKAPVASVNVAAPRIGVDGQVLTDLTIVLRWVPGLVTLEQASMQHGQATYTATGTINTDRDTVAITARLNEATLAALRQIVQDRRLRFAEGSLLRKFADQLAKVPAITGDVTATIQLSGEPAHPTAAISFKVTEATLAGSALPQVTGSLQVNAQEVRILALEARQDQSYAMVTGTVSLEGPVELDFDAFNVNAALFQPWIRLPVTGSADVTAVISGTLDQPQMVGSAEIANVSGGGINLERVRVTTFTLSASRLDLEDVLLVRGPYRAELAASLPITISPFRVARDQPLDVSVALPQQDLALLSSVLPGITDAGGPLDARLHVTGTADRPAFEGYLTVANGHMRVAGLARPVTAIEVRVTAAGQTVTFERASAQVGRGSVMVSGTAGLTNLDPDRLAFNAYDLAAVIRDLPLSLPRVLEGTANAALNLQNPPGGTERAAITGNVRLSNTTIAVPPAGAVQAGILLPPIDYRLDVAVTARDNVWLRTPAANLQLAGSGHIGGTLPRPTVSASLESRRGTLSFPGAQFRVTFAAVDVFVPPPTTPATGGPPVFSPRITLRAEAQATVQGYQVVLTVSGPVDNLQPQLRSIPDLPQSELYALVIGVGGGPFELGRETQQLLTAGLGSFVARPLEQAIATGLGLAEFGVEFGVREPVRVRIGQYLLPQFFLTYITSVAAPEPTWTLRATYEVTPSFWVGVSVNELQEQRFEIQSIFRF